MNDDKLTKDREIHAAVRAMFRRANAPQNYNKLTKLYAAITEIYAVIGIELETCRKCSADNVKGDTCAYCTRTTAQA